MFSGDFAPLNGVRDQADITVPRKPCAMVLIAGLVSDPHLAVGDIGVPAHVENGGQRRFRLRRQVKVGSNIQPRHGLKVELFHGITFTLNLAGYHRFQRSPLRPGIKPEHALQLPPHRRVFFRPIVRGDFLQPTGIGEFRHALFEILVERRRREIRRQLLRTLRRNRLGSPAKQQQDKEQSCAEPR